jgi:GNAT superfamily N-acetyltransferase
VQPADVVIRAATEADLAELLRLYTVLAVGRPGAEPAGERASARILADVVADPRRDLLVAAAPDRLLGTVDLLIVANLTRGGRPWAIVENVVVDEPARRSGIGARLMAEVERRARLAGCYKLQLLSRKQRTEAHAFYESAGFTAVAEGFRRYLD